MPQPNVPPTSSVIAAAMSGAASISVSAAALRSVRRSPAGVAAHAGKAAAAASTALRASSRPAAAARVTVSPVSGSLRSKRAPAGRLHPLAADQQPLLLELHRRHVLAPSL